MARIPVSFDDPDADTQALQDYTSRLPVELPQQLVGTGAANAVNNLFAPVGDTPRYQTWPEQLVRSGFTLPHDVVSGEVPTNLGLRREDFTDIPDTRQPSNTFVGRLGGFRESPELGPSGELIGRTQDIAGMAGGGFAAKPNAVTAMAEASKVGAPIAGLERAPVFYSALEHAVNNSKTKIASADQWLGELRNQPGVKQEELDWVLHDLPSGKITKDELEQYVNEHKVELKEINKGAPTQRLNEISGRLQDVMKERLRLGLEPDSAAKTEKMAELNTEHDALYSEVRRLQSDSSAQTQHSQWQLPGGTNYREMIMTLPDRKFEMSEAKAKQVYDDIYKNGGKDWSEILPHERAQWTKMFGDQDTRAAGFTHSHWPGIINPVAHIRMNDRFIPHPEGPSLNDKLANPKGWKITPPDQTTSGKWMVKSKDYNSKGFHFDTKAEAEANLAQQIAGERPGGPQIGDRGLNSLHVEEGQSDLHQAGRHQGYVGEKEKLQPQFDAIEKKIVDSGDEQVMSHPELKDALKAAVEKKIITADEARTYQRYSDINAQQQAGNKPVMDAPFKKDATVDLILKRMIRQAAEEGKDAISWTPGQAQADRYDLSKHVDTVSIKEMKNFPDDYSIYIKEKNGKEVEEKIKRKELTDWIGKEAAEKLLNEPIKNGYRSLEGLDLKIGGEFHKKLYDEVWVNKANAIAKKFGGKVEQGNDNAAVIEKHPFGGYYVKYSNKESPMMDTKEDALKWLKQNNLSGQPIHVLRITPQLRDAALNKGFSLFADTGKVGAPLAALTRVEHNPFKLAELEKQHGVSLTPVEHNPFTTDAYHGSPNPLRSDAIEPKGFIDIHHDTFKGEDQYQVWDKVNKRYISPEFASKAEAENWANTRVGSEFYSTENHKLAGDYATQNPNGKGKNISPLKIDTRDYHTVDAKGKPWDAINHQAIFEAEQLGKKGIVVKNVLDDANPQLGARRGPQTVYITLDPSTVRSRFAKFDPKLFGESGLLKSAGLPIPMQEHLYNLQNYISTIEDAPADQQKKLLQHYMTHRSEENPASVGISGHTAALGAAKAAEWLAFLGARNYPKVSGPMTAAWVAQWPLMGHMLKDDVKKQLKAGVKPEDIEFKPGSVGDLFGLVSKLQAKYGDKAHRLEPVSHDPFKDDK